MRGKQSANRIGGWRLFAPLIAICVLVLVLALPALELTLVDLATLQSDYTDTFKKIIDPIMPKLIANSPGQIYHFLESALEKAVLSACLKHFEGNQVKTSETLGISRNTLRDRIAKFGLY